MTLTRSTSRSEPVAEVILFNDDVSSMEMVVEAIADTIPTLSNPQAIDLTMVAHQEGQVCLWRGPWPEAEIYRRRLAERGLTLAPIAPPETLSTAELEQILRDTAARKHLTLDPKLAADRPRSKSWFRLPRRFKFTSVGWKFTLITMLVSIAAFNTGNNPLYLLFGLLLGLIIISGILSEQVLQRIQVKRQFPKRIFAGQEILIPVTVNNLKRRLSSFSLQISERLEGVVPEHRPSLYLLKIDPEEQVSTYYRYTFPHRGLWISQGFEISTSFPFELFRKGVEVDQGCDVIVYPRLAPPPPLPRFGGIPQGAQPRPYRGSAGEFFALREFRSSDDVRSIHWKSSAKRDQLVIKELEQQEAEKITICFYNSWIPYGQIEPYRPDDLQDHRQILEHGVEICAGLAEYLLSLGHPVALVTLGNRTPFGTGSTQLDRILTFLAQLRFHRDPENPPGLDLAPQFDLHPMERCAVIAYGRGFPSTSPAQAVARIPMRGVGKV